MNASEREKLQEAIAYTQYKYFGDYPLSDAESDAVEILVQSAQAALSSAPTPLSNQTNGIIPTVAPTPPEVEPVKLVRYGLKWTGGMDPVCAPMEGGYWTPWHVADMLVNAHPQSPKAEWTDARLGELLAILHRDGGHHTTKVGLEQSFKDAMQIASAAVVKDAQWDAEGNPLNLEAAARDAVRMLNIHCGECSSKNLRKFLKDQS